MVDAPNKPSPPVCVIVGSGTAMLWSISGVERIRRQLKRAGIADSAVVEAAGEELPALPPGDRVLLLRADHVFEELVFPSLLTTPDVALMPTDGGTSPAAISLPREWAATAWRALRADDALPSELSGIVSVQTSISLAGSYNQHLRKRAEFYVLKVTPDNRAAVEDRMFKSSLKGITDVLSKYVYPWPVKHLTRLSAKLGLIPNHVTFIGLLCTLATTWFWWNGHLALGFITAWSMLVLDTVDGKLARTTLTSSKIGDIFDHGIDLIHPPFWYWAFIHGLQPSFPHTETVMTVLVTCYVAQRLQEGFFIKAYGIEMHTWRPFDSHFRSITARRDPNVGLLQIATLLGAPATGMLVVTAWTVLSLGVHTYQIVHAGVLKARGGKITSWLTEPLPESP